MGRLLGVIVLAALAAVCVLPHEGFAMGSPPPSQPPAPAQQSAQSPYAASGSAVRTEIASYFAPQIAGGGRYMEGTCDAPRTNFPNYAGFPVIKCRYTNSGVTASIALLDAPADRLAAWVITGCEDAASSDLAICARTLSAKIWGDSNAQFPVSGFVIEPGSSVRGAVHPELTYCILYRDGVPIRTASFATSPAQNGACASEAVWTEPATKVLGAARIATTTKEMYHAAGGSENVDGTAFMDVARRLYQAAWTSDRNELVSATAKWLKAQGEFD